MFPCYLIGKSRVDTGERTVSLLLFPGLDEAAAQQADVLASH